MIKHLMSDDPLTANTEPAHTQRERENRENVQAQHSSRVTGVCWYSLIMRREEIEGPVLMICTPLRFIWFQQPLYNHTPTLKLKNM